MTLMDLVTNISTTALSAITQHGTRNASTTPGQKFGNSYSLTSDIGSRNSASMASASMASPRCSITRVE